MSQRKPKILFIGPKRSQEAIIREALEDIAKIKVASKKKQKNLSTGYDFYVLWATFCSHTHQNQVKKAADEDQIIVHFGGITQMIEHVKEAIELHQQGETKAKATQRKTRRPEALVSQSLEPTNLDKT